MPDTTQSVMNRGIFYYYYSPGNKQNNDHVVSSSTPSKYFNFSPGSWCDGAKVCQSGVCTFQVLLCVICFKREVHRWFVCVCVYHSPQPSDLTLCSVDWRLIRALPHDSRALLFL